jgi:hypothetical protein
MDGWTSAMLIETGQGGPPPIPGEGVDGRARKEEEISKPRTCYAAWF